MYSVHKKRFIGWRQLREPGRGDFLSATAWPFNHQIDEQQVYVIQLLLIGVEYVGILLNYHQYQSV